MDELRSTTGRSIVYEVQKGLNSLLDSFGLEDIVDESIDLEDDEKEWAKEHLTISVEPHEKVALLLFANDNGVHVERATFKSTEEIEARVQEHVTETDSIFESAFWNVYYIWYDYQRGRWQSEQQFVAGLDD